MEGVSLRRVKGSSALGLACEVTCYAVITGDQLRSAAGGPFPDPALHEIHSIIGVQSVPSVRDAAGPADRTAGATP